MTRPRWIAALRRRGAIAYFFIGTAAGSVWTTIGWLLSERSFEFLREWLLLQGPFLVGIGSFLLLLSGSGRLNEISKSLGCSENAGSLGRKLDWLVIASVTVIGSSSLISMGFNGKDHTLYFMWVTCGLVCWMASIATRHALCVLTLSESLPKCSPKLHVYSPADTPSVRSFAQYVSLFGVVVTIGYSFAFAATLGGRWTADPVLVKTVQLFWPMIYVPLCLGTLFYPHFAIHRMIREEKDRVIISLQQEIVAISSGGSLSSSEIDRLNSLADLVQKIENTPNYPRSLQIIGGSAFTAIVNIASVVAPRETMINALRQAISF